MARFVVSCPSCQSELFASRLSCGSCGTSLEGRFEVPALLRLPPDDLAFVTAFVRSSGSLKAMAQMFGVSYPTIRGRLDEVIARLEAASRDADARRHEILDALESGKLTAAAAAEQLKKAGV